MRNLFLTAIIVFAFSTMLYASDIAFYVGQWNTDGWYDASQFDDVDTIISETGDMFVDIQQFDDDQLDEFGKWAEANTDDGEFDIIWLNGCMPSALYPYVNKEPDGSRAEEWLDGGNMIINVGDWFAYVSYEIGARAPSNGPQGAANILDLSSGIIISANNTQMKVTPTGKWQMYCSQFRVCKQETTENRLSKYIELILSFLHDRISPLDFEREYLALYLNDETWTVRALPLQI